MSAPPDVRLRRRRDLASLLQIAIATAAVALGNAIAPERLALFAALVAWAFVRRLPEEASRRATRLWTLGIAAALVATLARALLRNELLDAGVDFLLLLAVQRFFNRQRTREHLQLLLLGSLLMVVGAVVNTDLAYPPLFVAYLFAAAWALILCTLVAEGERLGPRVMLELGREGLRRQRELLRAAAGVTALAVSGAMIVFLLFPRWGVGAFLRGAMGKQAESGFSGEVSLGDFGRIKSDSTVVMRIRVHGDDPHAERTTWHLRGSSFDHYSGGRWSHSRRGEASEVRAVWSWSSLVRDGVPLLTRTSSGAQPSVRARLVPGFAGSERLLHATVILEDIGADVLFVASEPLGVRLSARGPIEARARVHGGRNRELRVGKPPGPIQYEFLARAGAPSEAELRAIAHPDVPPLFAAFAEPAELSPRVGELARRLTADTTSRADAIAAIMEHLGAFQYTLDLTDADPRPEGVDPVEWFLFDTQAGHCEYYATALVVLLRELRIPARIVNGYYGAHRNELGGFYAVRQADAHSWVEVHFGSLGWVTFDPTPPGGRTAGDGAPWWPAAAQLFDALRNTYLEYVIDYDLAKQLSLLENVGLRGVSGPSVTGRAIGGGLVAFGVCLFVIVRWRRRRGHPIPPELRVLQPVLRRLARRGFSLREDESLPRFAARVRAAEIGGAEAIGELAARYDAMRFAARRGDLDELRRLARTAKAELDAAKAT